MTEQYVPERGDIIWIDCDPSAGSEIQKRRPALVMSIKQVNAHGLVTIVPITNTSRKPELLYPKLEGLSTTGYLVPVQIRSFDWIARNATFIEKAAPDLVDQCGHLLEIILGFKTS